MAGIAYGVGVGPGDPELITLKALRIMRTCDVIAAPGEEVSNSRAYEIALACLPELGQKELLALPAPMVSDRTAIEKAQRENAHRIERILDCGRNVAILVLGDSSIYSTFGYLRDVLVADGYRVQTVAGVPSFCAAAATLGMSLAEWDQQLHVVPLVHSGFDASLAGTQILMKPGAKMGELRDYARSTGRKLCVVENCGMADERVYRDADEAPDRTGYLSVAFLWDDRQRDRCE